MVDVTADPASFPMKDNLSLWFLMQPVQPAFSTELILSDPDWQSLRQVPMIWLFRWPCYNTQNEYEDTIKSVF